MKLASLYLLAFYFVIFFTTDFVKVRMLLRDKYVLM